MSPAASAGGLLAHLEAHRGDVDLRLELTATPGRPVALVGPNGAGKSTTLAVLGGEGPPAVLGTWLERQSVALQKNNAAAFKAAAGAAATWRDLRAPGLEEAALEVLAEAERLAALAA